MLKTLLIINLAIFTFPTLVHTKEQVLTSYLPEKLNIFVDNIHSTKNDAKSIYQQLMQAPKQCSIDFYRAKNIEPLLLKYRDSLGDNVIDTVLTTIKCHNQRKPHYYNSLTIIDFSLPSSQKRLWIFDLIDKKLLFHTYVSHGITTGAKESEFFSDKYNSKASSIGVFTTEKKYYGRHGLSLRLQGLERRFNYSAMRRNIVMHGAWYVNEEFVNKYGRIGRSWGCPAVPNKLIQPIVEAINQRSLLVTYYPGDRWILKSHYLNCRKASLKSINGDLVSMRTEPIEDDRGDILFADRDNDNIQDQSDPILVVTANDYRILFNDKVPLKRMLRRQINQQEYIALNQNELRRLDKNQDNIINKDDEYILEKLDLVVPHVIIRGGRYLGTKLRTVKLGTIEEIRLSENLTLVTSQKTIVLKLSTHFIRWLGL